MFADANGWEKGGAGLAGGRRDRGVAPGVESRRLLFKRAEGRRYVYDRAAAYEWLQEHLHATLGPRFNLKDYLPHRYSIV